MVIAKEPKIRPEYIEKAIQIHKQKPIDIGNAEDLWKRYEGKGQIYKKQKKQVSQMVEAVDKQVLKELKAIRKDIAEIKEFVEDSILSEDDIKALEAGRKEKAAGTLTSQEELEKELGL
ncbi:hypothetical protein ACFL1B_04930 [Nanoarchaeota archaeon]